MKILKRIKSKRKIICRCGCKFQWETGDIQKEENTAGRKSFVECPDCGERCYISIVIK